MDNIIDAGAVAVIIGIVQAIKNFGFPAKYSPILAIALGIAWSISFVQPGTTIFAASWQGLIIGLSASGLYSGTKAVIKPTPDTPPIDSLPQ